MDRDLKFYIAFIVLPAVALAVGGVMFLCGEVRRQQEGVRNWREIRGEYMSTLAQNVQSALKDAKGKQARVCGLRDIESNRVERVKGGWTAPVPSNLDIAVAWARLGGGEVAALEVDLRDNLTGSDPRLLFAVGSCIVALLFVILLIGGLLLVRAARRAREESERKTTFIDNLSHELKVPLAVVRMKAERLLAGKIAEPEKLQAAYQAIADENGEVIRQVDDLLDLVRTGKGTRRYARSTFDLNSAVRDAVSSLRDRFAQDGLAVTLADSSVRVNADADAVRQIVRNLLDNAAKYAAAKGRVDVEVSHADGWARVTVSDRGDGVPPDQRERIFERFYRIDNDLTRTTGGTGIGLSLARCFARDMGGDVTVAERPGGGSIFTLELPEETHG